MPRPVPRPHPPEFRRRAVELAREKAKPISQLARDLGVSDSCLRNWMAKADIEQGLREGPSTDAQAELVELRRKLRVSEMENEILRGLRPTWGVPLRIVSPAANAGPHHSASR